MMSVLDTLVLGVFLRNMAELGVHRRTANETAQVARAAAERAIQTDKPDS